MSLVVNTWNLCLLVQARQGLNNQKPLAIIRIGMPKADTFKNQNPRDFPGGAVVKNPPANAGDTGSSPGPGRSHMPWSN